MTSARLAELNRADWRVLRAGKDQEQASPPRSDDSIPRMR